MPAPSSRVALTTGTIAAVLLTPGALVGCTSSPKERCSLEPRLASTSIARGGTLAVTITRPSCWADLSAHRREASLVVTRPSSTPGGTVRLAFEEGGTFRHSIPIPPSTPMGMGDVTTSRPCDDHESSCAGEPAVTFAVR